MKVGIFLPCYIDAFFREVGMASLEILERLDCAATRSSSTPRLQ